LRYALGMHEIQSIITERVDDIPLLLEEMQQMGLSVRYPLPHPQPLARSPLGLGDHNLAQRHLWELVVCGVMHGYAQV
jgi:hypothetical protein